MATKTTKKAAKKAAKKTNGTAGDGLVARFGKNVKAMRESKGLSQQALADKAKLSVSYVSMLEKAKRTPPLDTCEQLAKALAVDPVVLMA